MSEEKKKHPVLKAAAIAAGTACAAYTGYAGYLFCQAFDMEHSRYTAMNPKAREDEGKLREWYASSSISSDSIQSFDGLMLRAKRIENHPASHDFILMAHGYHSCSDDMLAYMKKADENGWNILAPDSRACGSSQGKFCGLGWPEHYDLISWVTYFTNMYPDARIALFGISLGGSAILNAVGDYLPANVKCAVSVCAWNNIKEEIIHAADKVSGISTRSFMPAVDIFAKQFVHFSIYDVSTLHQLGNAKIPMLFADGGNESMIPAGMLQESYDACASQKEMKVYRGMDYCECWKDEAFFGDVETFLRKYIARKAA